MQVELIRKIDLESSEFKELLNNPEILKEFSNDLKLVEKWAGKYFKNPKDTYVHIRTVFIGYIPTHEKYMICADELELDPLGIILYSSTVKGLVYYNELLNISEEVSESEFNSYMDQVLKLIHLKDRQNEFDKLKELIS